MSFTASTVILKLMLRKGAFAVHAYVSTVVVINFFTAIRAKNPILFFCAYPFIIIRHLKISVPFSSTCTSISPLHLKYEENPSPSLLCLRLKIPITFTFLSDLIIKFRADHKSPNQMSVISCLIYFVTICEFFIIPFRRLSFDCLNKYFF